MFGATTNTHVHVRVHVFNRVMYALMRERERGGRERAELTLMSGGHVTILLTTPP